MDAMLLAGRLAVPDDTDALLWDMDGVLLDTLTMDYELVNRLLHVHAPTAGDVPRHVVRAHFPYDIPDFWRLLLGKMSIDVPQDTFDELVREHEKARASHGIAVHDGVTQVLADARDQGIRSAVVSNNPAADVERILVTAKLRDYFNVVVGNDDPGIAKKPAPDSYLEAARRLRAARCVALEDSLLGARAARAAGCWTIGVATGAADFEELSASPDVDRCYVSLAPCQVVLGREGVTRKSLATPNEFVSHMIEHIAWRLGCSVDVAWTHDDWHQLGEELGGRIAELCRLRGSTATLGMIDDGSCEIALRSNVTGNVRLRAADQVDLEWFLGLRCEQLPNGQPLVSMLRGLTAGCGVDLDILVASAEDPHHTWEGIFRGVGIALSKLATDRDAAVPQDAAPPSTAQAPAIDPAQPVASVERGWDVWHCSATGTRLRRETAESIVDVELDLGTPDVSCDLSVSDSINVAGIADLLHEFAFAGGLRVSVSFNATRLSSSHVVTEDIGMALGRALRCIAVERMTAFGINGAGANIDSADNLTGKPVRVGVSMEGRKFWKFVPLSGGYPDLRKKFLVGHTLPNGLYSEDLDDFIDGFAGGLGASVMIHIGPGADATTGWRLVFDGLGAAMKEFLAPNPDRRALAPGVKATLA